MKPATPEAYQLLQDGAIALAEVESNGIRIDMDYIERASRKTLGRIERIEEKLEDTDVVKLWRKKYGTSMNLYSDQQLGRILYADMGYTSVGQNSRGWKMDEETLTTIDDPFIDPYLRAKKLKNAVTRLKGIAREVVDNLLHPFFNLHTVVTYRSSSDNPNWQNIPIRDLEIATLIRQAIVPREGNQIGELDFKGIEVSVGACYHKDPTMVSYILDKTKDMHRDMAMECYCLPEKEISKPIRQAGKGQFVFPQFYGDWYKHCAAYLWNDIYKVPLVTKSGMHVADHLARLGITKLGALDPKAEPIKGTFEHHIQKIERAFWGERFKVYAQWRRDWHAEYQKRAYFRTLTGFVCQGFMTRNQVTNYPVQGSAFHCLLWSLIRIVRHELPKRNMKTLIIGQIHDSMIADIVPSERDEFLAICHRVTTRLLQRHWPWIILPMEVEAEVAPVGGSWADKEKYEIAA